MRFIYRRQFMRRLFCQTAWATSFFLTLIGTIGILRLAKRGNIISAIKPELDILIARDYRISKRIYDLVLKQEGEAE